MRLELFRSVRESNSARIPISWIPPGSVSQWQAEWGGKLPGGTVVKAAGSQSRCVLPQTDKSREGSVLVCRRSFKISFAPAPFFCWPGLSLSSIEIRVESYPQSLRYHSGLRLLQRCANPPPNCCDSAKWLEESHTRLNCRLPPCLSKSRPALSHYSATFSTSQLGPTQPTSASVSLGLLHSLNSTPTDFLLHFITTITPRRLIKPTQPDVSSNSNWKYRWVNFLVRLVTSRQWDVEAVAEVLKCQFPLGTACRRCCSRLPVTPMSSRPCGLNLTCPWDQVLITTTTNPEDN